VVTGRYLLAGVMTGLVAKWADGSGPSWLGDLGTGLGFWVFVTTGIGWLAASRSTAAAGAVAFFLGLNAGYYAYTIVVLSYPVDRATVLGWSVLAVTACPLLALIVRAGRDRPVPGAVVLGVVAATGYLTVLWDQVLQGTDGPYGMADRRISGAISLLMAGILVAAPRRPRLVLVAVAAAFVGYRPVSLLLDATFGRLPML